VAFIRGVKKTRTKPSKIHDLLAGGILAAISGFAIYAAVKDYDEMRPIAAIGGVMITICGYCGYRRIVYGYWPRSTGGD
jgi:predicted CDP-diglyceride synthetase/phosphatidate cytidylyltransferase|tara:strand:- start:1262 stop:1498 length:237 start_codon:yes stop_codon:yes gene_type:complete